jgi:hypothetical protein
MPSHTQPPFLTKSNLSSAVSSGCKEMPDTLYTLDEVMMNTITDSLLLMPIAATNIMRG